MREAPKFCDQKVTKLCSKKKQNSKKKKRPLFFWIFFDIWRGIKKVKYMFLILLEKLKEYVTWLKNLFLQIDQLKLDPRL
jgi:hypothetical protein